MPPDEAILYYDLSPSREYYIRYLYIKLSKSTQGSASLKVGTLNSSYFIIFTCTGFWQIHLDVIAENTHTHTHMHILAFEIKYILET